ncbi:hypothetical protein GCM10008955_40160 [Deinococcus malanensis]|uniref:Flagellar FliJ protein n=1 Tax=Deinococcus malanensis TaxID=1706855 RepID=A0ABQ2F2M9_9DEIO|nr:hypothetical protein [Deinococcus malanensis]GGK42381.1 hypothetical protein GCM10008955_40160 [Deinococcus malanensis]
MDEIHGQLQRVLKLALNSPYEGERRKAASLLLQRLEHVGLTLGDLDPSLSTPEAENSFRQQAGLAYQFEISLKSREEAMFYSGLLSRSPESWVTWLEGHRLLCQANSSAKQEADRLFQMHALQLQQRLVLAQQAAMKEYNERRRQLFLQAVEEELRTAR